MFKITQPKILDDIIKHLFKDKRKTPNVIYLDDEDVYIHWKNRNITQVRCFVDIELKTSPHGALYVHIKLEPFVEKEKYRLTSMIFNIDTKTNSIFIWNP